MIPQQTREDWIQNKINNELLIKTNLMQIEMATEIIKLCEKKIKEFPEIPKIEKKLSIDPKINHAVK